MFKGLKSSDAGGLFGLLSSSSCFLQSFWGFRVYDPAAVWILLHKDQTRGWSMSLKNGVVLRFGQAEVNFCAGVQVPRRQNSPRLKSSYYIILWIWHCGISLLLIYSLIVSMFTISDFFHFWSHLNNHRSPHWCQYHVGYDAHLSKMSCNVCRFRIVKRWPETIFIEPGL